MRSKGHEAKLSDQRGWEILICRSSIHTSLTRRDRGCEKQVRLRDETANPEVDALQRPRRPFTLRARYRQCCRFYAHKRMVRFFGEEKQPLTFLHSTRDNSHMRLRRRAGVPLPRFSCKLSTMISSSPFGFPFRQLLTRQKLSPR